MVRVQFILPGVSIRPIGGFKVFYEYANRLTRTGKYSCAILFDCQYTLLKYHLPKLLRKMLVRELVRYYPRWFKLDKRVDKIPVFEWTNEGVPDADIIVGSGYRTLEYVQNLSEKKGKQFYFVQGHENWGDVTDEMLQKSYGLGMRILTVSKWLKDSIDPYSRESAVLVPNGINFDEFGLDIPPESRNPHSIAMLYSSMEVKGCIYGLAALDRLHQLIPDLKVHLFGAEKRPKDLPDWTEYTENASTSDLRVIYNNSAVFMATSISDGFGLCGAESMACGCALVSTDFEGISTYASDGINALICKKANVDDLVDKTQKLLNNQDLRLFLAHRGAESIKAFSWDNSVKKFDQCIAEAMQATGNGYNN